MKALSFNMHTSNITPNTKLFTGCFHMNYFLDNELIAVGVVDIFDEGMSSVYFYYDPKYKKLSPGVVAAIYEIEYINYLREHFP